LASNFTSSISFLTSLISFIAYSLSFLHFGIRFFTFLNSIWAFFASAFTFSSQFYIYYYFLHVWIHVFIFPFFYIFNILLYIHIFTNQNPRLFIFQSPLIINTYIIDLSFPTHNQHSHRLSSIPPIINTYEHSFIILLHTPKNRTQKSPRNPLLLYQLKSGWPPRTRLLTLIWQEAELTTFKQMFFGGNHWRSPALTQFRRWSAINRRRFLRLKFIRDLIGVFWLTFNWRFRRWFSLICLN
jgi:hypothetical protein